MSEKKQMPDVAQENQTSQNHALPLQKVGMRGIQLPLRIESKSGGEVVIPGAVDAFVSLDKKAARGIHMSRLFMFVQELSEKPLYPLSLQSTLQQFLESHAELSHSAYLNFKFSLPVQRAALKSAHKAWRNYPVQMSGRIQNGEFKAYLEVVVTYSSTCPASAALARQLIQENFLKNFPNSELDKESVHQWLGRAEGINATPHAQRSLARVKVEIAQNLSIESLIDLIENALQTPVQGAVKREDEQEFALRNGQNLMFCEDAARRIAQALSQAPGVLDYIAEVSHLESLHPHDAVAVVSQGLDLTGFES